MPKLADSIKFEDKPLKIVEEDAEMFGIQDGPETFYMSRAELQEAIDGKIDRRTMFKHNMATRLSLAGKNAHSPDMKTVVESVTFKGPK